MDRFFSKETRHVILPSKIAATSTRVKNEAEGSTTTATSVTIVKRVSLCDTQIRVVIRRSEQSLRRSRALSQALRPVSGSSNIEKAMLMLVPRVVPSVAPKCVRLGQPFRRTSGPKMTVRLGPEACPDRCPKRTNWYLAIQPNCLKNRAESATNTTVNLAPI